MAKLGEWEWSEETTAWTLHLHPGSRVLVGLRLTMNFMMFDDERVRYSHLVAPTMHPEDLISATIQVTGGDGREYLWNRISEHWRTQMNRGKRSDTQSGFPFRVSELPLRTESSKDFSQFLR